MYFITVIASTLNNMEVPMDSPYYKSSVFLTLGTWIIFVTLTIVLFIHVMLVVFGKEKRRFYFDEASDLYTTRKNKVKNRLLYNRRRFFYRFKVAVRLAQRCCKDGHL